MFVSQSQPCLVKILPATISFFNQLSNGIIFRFTEGLFFYPNQWITKLNFVMQVGKLVLRHFKQFRSRPGADYYEDYKA